jgi:hypothetical protein
MGVPEKLVSNQRRTDEPYLKMGAVPLGTCLPYQLGNLPLPGTHFAWEVQPGLLSSTRLSGPGGIGKAPPP